MARKKSTKKTSPVTQAYNRERKRIQRQINRMHKRGYMGMEDMLPPVPKKITQASVRRLKKITTKDLYDKADFVDLTTGKVIGTGKEGRKIERQRAAEKGQETRRRRKRQLEAEQFAQDIQDAAERDRQARQQRFEEQRRQRDEEARRRLEQEQSYREQFQEGAMIMRGVRDAIASHSDGEAEAAQTLQGILEEAIEEFGEETVVFNLATTDEDVIGYVQKSLKYRPSSGQFQSRANQFYQMLTRRAPSAEQMQSWQDVQDSGDYINDTENWNYPQDDFGTAGTQDID